MIPPNPYILNLNIPSCDISGCVTELQQRHESGESTGSLKCWLTYRCLEGKLDFETWLTRVRSVLTQEDDEHMLARWTTSQLAAETYLLLKHNDQSSAMLSAQAAIIGWRMGNSIWNPQILNVLRCSCLLSYHRYLAGKTEEGLNISDLGIQLWKKSVADLRWQDWTLRFTEMRDDIVALQMLVFIAGRCGVPITEMKWMNPAICMPKERWSPFYEAMIKMGELNQGARIWK